MKIQSELLIIKYLELHGKKISDRMWSISTKMMREEFLRKHGIPYKKKRNRFIITITV